VTTCLLLSLTTTSAEVTQPPDVFREMCTSRSKSAGAASLKNSEFRSERSAAREGKGRLVEDVLLEGAGRPVLAAAAESSEEDWSDDST
jgi:hypothetical protein